MGSSSPAVRIEYGSSTEMNYITYLHMAICTVQEILLNRVLLLKQISQQKKKE